MTFNTRLAMAGTAGIVAAILFALWTLQWPQEGIQRGFRGTGMAEIYNTYDLSRAAVANILPDAIPPLGDDSGPKASEAYKNVQVLGNVPVTEFVRLMASVTAWVAPDAGCEYCHNADAMESDRKYTKVVARRMFQMVRHINADWKAHVAETGVTCYTCHRGQPVPKAIWFRQSGPFVGSPGKNLASAVTALTSLPYDPFTPFLQQGNDIRVEGSVPLTGANLSSIKQTEWTYGLMMHISDALGVNCTYCHNTRQFGDWSQSTPQRGTAWYGIRMVRDINTAYLNPLQGAFPAERLGREGDAPKANCATCHNGVYKPLFGANMVADYPELK